MSEHVFKRGKGYPDRRLMHPHREWALGLAALMVVLCTGGFFAAQTYIQYRDIKMLEEVALQQVPQYNDVAVQNVLAAFRVRKELYETFIGETALVAEEKAVESVASSTAVAEESASAFENEDFLEEVQEETVPLLFE